MQMRSIVNKLTLCDNRGTKFRERRMRLTKACVLGAKVMFGSVFRSGYHVPGTSRED